jgi:hypothetical protein
MTLADFSKEHTGGGCWAWTRKLADGRTVVVTDEALAPELFQDGRGADVGIYPPLGAWQEAEPFEYFLCETEADLNARLAELV